MFDENVICHHFAFITDDNYVMPTAVAIKSLVSNLNTKGKTYCVHICTFGLSDENKRILKNYALPRVSVCIHEADKKSYEDKFSQINQSSHVTPTALLKFDLPAILLGIDKVLYLDGDIIIKRDISALFDFILDENYVAASFEFWKYLMQVYDTGKSETPDFYFNSGVMLLNLAKLRKDNISEKLWKTKFNQFNSESKKFKLMDQDVFNAVCKEKVLPLPVKYNFNCAFYARKYVKSINSLYGTDYNDEKALLEDAVVIHYVGKEDKPWSYIGRNCQRFWDSYYEMAGFDFSKLNRICIKHGASYFIERLCLSIQQRGFINTILYVLRK